MCRDDDPECLRQRKRVIQLFIGNSEGTFVGQKNLKAGVASPNDLFEIALGLRVITGYAHVETEIAGARSIRLAQPQLERLDWSFVAGGTHHFNKSRRSSD